MTVWRPAALSLLRVPRYPDIEPYQSGLLDTGDGNLVYWETCGNPDGVPALIVHGGPGSGCTAGNRRSFDQEKFRIILFDQRNCGRSLPHASDPAADMSLNTTGHLLKDMEQLREHLGVEKWLLRGGSWGVTLSLAYAERHPERVSGMLMLSVTSTRRLELDWLYRGVGRFFPGHVGRPVVVGLVGLGPVDQVRDRGGAGGLEAGVAEAVIGQVAALEAIG